MIHYNINTEEGMRQAIQWMDTFMCMIKEGGTWAVPRAATIYQISKQTKSITRLVGAGDSAIERVVAKMGWTINIKQEGQEWSAPAP